MFYTGRSLQQRTPQEAFEPDCGRRADECVPGFGLCLSDSHRSHFEYVGSGSGGYEKQHVYNYVGDGHGEYEKTEMVSYSNYRLRPCAVCAITLALLLGGALGFLLYTSAGSRLFHGDTLTLLQGGYEDGCWVRDCMCLHDKLNTWSHERRDWCCENKGVACPAHGVVKAKPGVGTLVGEVQGCSTRCHIFNASYDCGKRINFTAFDTFKNRTDNCVAAYQLVLSQCSFCSACSLADTSCGATLARAALAAG